MCMFILFTLQILIYCQTNHTRMCRTWNRIPHRPIFTSFKSPVAVAERLRCLTTKLFSLRSGGFESRNRVKLFSPFSVLFSPAFYPMTRRYMLLDNYATSVDPDRAGWSGSVVFAFQKEILNIYNSAQCRSWSAAQKTSRERRRIPISSNLVLPRKTFSLLATRSF